MGALLHRRPGVRVRGLVRDHITLQTNYGSVFYLTTGFHGLHVTGGLIAFLFVLGRTYVARRFTHSQATSAIVVSYYWHFVDIVWVGPVLDHLPHPVTGTQRAAHQPDRPGPNPPLPPDLGAAPPPARLVRGPRLRPARSWAGCTPRSPAGHGLGGEHRRDPQAIAKGRAIFLEGCSSCHGLNAQGGSTAPTLIGVGAAAAVDFQVGTGRMPLAAPSQQAKRGTVSTPRSRSARSPPTSPRWRPAPRSRRPRSSTTSTPTCRRAASCSAPTARSATTSPAAGGALTEGKYAPSLP
jgi:hypothetical protein